MSYPPIVSRAEWLEARRKLLSQEKELTHRIDALNTERRQLPMVEIEKDYVFEGPNGKASLLDLFEGRQQLLVYHFMFDPEWDAGCPSCSYQVDNLPHHLSHMHVRSTTLTAVSRAPLQKILAYKERMGWTFPWYSSYGSDFNYDFHVTQSYDVVNPEYNFQPLPVEDWQKGDWSASCSGFVRSEASKSK